MSLGRTLRRRELARVASAVFSLTLAAFVGCSGDDDGPPREQGDPADCDLIANRCHAYEDVSELARECHETGHDGVSPATCTEMKARCLAECPPGEPDGGAGGGSGGTGGSAAGSDAGGAGHGGGEGGASSGGTSPGGAPSGEAGYGGNGAETACERLGRLCHGVGAGLPEECHELGHDGDEPACEARLEECLAACGGD